MIVENLNESTISKTIMLQIIVKAINDTIEFDELVFTLLVFGTYSRIDVMNSSTSSLS